MTIEADIAVIGGGIAGLSAAAFLAEHHRVIVLEAETQPGVHASGRSAALFAEAYGNAPVRALTRASRTFFEAPPVGFSEAPLLGQRGAMFIASPGQEAALTNLAAAVGPALRSLDPTAARSLVPQLRPDRLVGALFDSAAADIDVHALLQGFVRMIRNAGGRLLTDHAVSAIERTPIGWRFVAGDEQVVAAMLINAAGAWGDRIAALAGVTPIGLEPRRRTAFLFDPPIGVDVSGWPLIIDVDEQFYVKPESGRLLGSPADETPTEPCDAQPDEYDIAVAAARIEEALDLTFRTIRSKWAGLRTFALDRSPVVGFASDDDRFFWLVGQGGYGVQTAPAIAALVASLVNQQGLPDRLDEEGLDLTDISPRRFGSCPS